MKNYLFKYLKLHQFVTALLWSLLLSLVISLLNAIAYERSSVLDSISSSPSFLELSLVVLLFLLILKEQGKHFNLTPFLSICISFCTGILWLHLSQIMTFCLTCISFCSSVCTIWSISFAFAFGRPFAFFGGIIIIFRNFNILYAFFSTFWYQKAKCFTFVTSHFWIDVVI